MTDAPSSNEPGNRTDHETETRTRRAFTQAAEASLGALARVEESDGPDLPEVWPSTPEAAEHFSPTTREPVDPSTARDRGWLVTGPAPTPPGEGRLAGVRMAVKDVIDVAGLPTQNGTPGGAWRHPDRSADAWQAPVAQGAVCIGKAATHEMAWGVTTPQIPHPVDSGRAAGGSSGGSAAAVAAGVADAALGTDTGGSVRIPAALCGVVGIRPTVGSTSTRGVTPLAPSQDVVGPLAHDVATCGAVLEVLQGRALAGLPVSGLRVGVPDNLGALDDDVATAWAESLTTLRTAGVVLVPLPDAPLRLAGAVSLLTMLLESAEHHAESVRRAPEGYGGEARALLTLGTELALHREAVTRARGALRRATARIFTEHDLVAVVTPTTACVAPSREAASVELAGRQVPVSVALTRFTAWASAIGLPAISVPAATTGLPVGVQVMAPPDAEAVCLALALTLETGATST